LEIARKLNKYLSSLRAKRSKPSPAFTEKTEDGLPRQASSLHSDAFLALTEELMTAGFTKVDYIQ